MGRQPGCKNKARETAVPCVGCGKLTFSVRSVCKNCAAHICDLMQAGKFTPVSYGTCANTKCNKPFPRYKEVSYTMTQQFCCPKCRYVPVEHRSSTYVPPKSAFAGSSGFSERAIAKTLGPRVRIESIPGPTEWEEKYV